MTLLNLTDSEMIDAYLDNQLDSEARSTFEARLTHESALLAALEKEQRLRVGLRTRIRQTRVPVSLRADIQTVLAATEPKPARWRRWLTWFATPRAIQPYAAAIYSLLLLVLLGGIFWFNQPAPPVEDHSVFYQLAGKHSVYLEVVSSLDVRGQPADIAAWFQARVPFSVSIPSLADWTLEGGRLGEFHHQGAVHLIYENAAGQHISLTLFMPRESDFSPNTRQRVGETDFFIGSDGQHPVILWRSGDVGYALVGYPDLTTGELLSIAVTLKSQVE